MPSFTPMTPEALVVAVADRAATPGGPVCVAVSAPDAAEPVTFARRVVTELKLRGRASEVVALHDFVRPASLRLEHGRADPDVYRQDWFDYPALEREVLRALREHRRWLPRLWDEASDRSARERRRPAVDDQILVVAGPMLLGRGLDFDVSVALTMSRGALERRTPAEDHWTIDALLEHTETEADIVVRYDHPARPAVHRRVA